jgi:hypothetical protein
LPEDEPHQIARPRADCGSNAELLPPLGDRVADEPVQTYRRKYESRHGKRGNRAAGQLLRARAGRDDVVADLTSMTGSAASSSATEPRIRFMASLMGRDVRTMTFMSKWGRWPRDT